MNEHFLQVTENEAGQRVDHFAAMMIPELSRSMALELIKAGQISIDAQPVKPSRRVLAGETVRVEIPAPRETGLTAENIPVPVVYEDEDVIVVDKPKGMVVHPAQGNWDHTLVNALLYQVEDLSGINGELRPGIVHRLDKDTSGLLVVAKNDAAHRALAEQIQARTAGREYLALVHGELTHAHGRVEAPIGRSPKDRKKMAVVAGGRPAVTHYNVVEVFKGYTLIRCKLETGRTHQIRVHLQYLGYPVAGDPLYGPRGNPLQLSGQALHACHLEFIHPVTGRVMSFDSQLPPAFSDILEHLRTRAGE